MKCEYLTPFPIPHSIPHYLWFAYAGVGATAFVGMLLFIFVTSRLDARKRSA